MWPSMLLAWHAVLIGQALLCGLLGDAGVHQIHLSPSISPISFCCFGKLMIELGIILDVLVDEQKGLVLT